MKKSVTVIDAKAKSKTKDKEKSKIRVAAYTRVSTEQEEQLNSLSVQQRYFEDLINKNPEWINVGIYYDEGISGTRLKKRDGFNKMIQDALDGKIDLILVKSISRFARNTVDALQTIRALKAKGIKVVFEKENIDSMDMKSEFILTIMSSLAQEESQSLSENIKWGKQKIFREGKVSIPYSHFLGYKQGGKYIMVIDKEQAKIVRYIYRLFLEGYSPYQISNKLNEENIPTVMNKSWTYNAILSILSNEKYCGDAILQKTFTVDFLTQKVKINEGEVPQYFVKNDHQPIIKRATWEETQLLLAKCKRNKSYKHCFSNFITCTICGSYYQRKPWYHEYYKNTIQTWICYNKYTSIRCSNIKLYEQQLELVFHEAILSLYEKYDEFFNDVSIILQRSIKTKTRQKQILKLLKKKNTPHNNSYEETMWRVLISKVEVFPDRKLLFYFIDENQIEFTLPKWKIKENDK